MSDQPIPPRIVEQTTKNLALARKFLAEVLDDPTVLHDIPEGTCLVLIDSSDNDPGHRKHALAVRQMFQGDAVTVQLVGLPTPDLEIDR